MNRVIFDELMKQLLPVFHGDANLDVLSLSSDISEESLLLPGFADVHVHLREPGFSYKETIASGTAAGARGGYTHLCSMPNLNPVPDCMENLAVQLDLIRRSARIAVTPYGAITAGQMGDGLSDMVGMADKVVAFSDDGRGVQSENVMMAAMEQAKRLGKIIVAHCEDNSLVNGGYIHDGEYARQHGHRGICSESEWYPIERDLALAEKIGCAYHVCHVSCAESVELIRKAKRRGVNVSCETAPHYLVLTDADLQEDGRFKMNPPLRSKRDRDALIEGILDGTVDMIATDHAPHSAEEKSRGLQGSAMGIVGLETAFPVLYTELVKTGILSLTHLAQLMSVAPRLRFGLPIGNDFSIWDLNDCRIVDPAKFLSKGRATPFAGRMLYGVCKQTIYGGNIVWQENLTEN